MGFGSSEQTLLAVVVLISLWIAIHCFHKTKYALFSPVSSLALFKGKPSFRQRCASLPFYFLSLALFSFFIALLDPLLYQPQGNEEPLTNNFSQPVEGIVIYFVLDQSGSMAKAAQIGTDRRHKITKLELLKATTKAFIAGDAKNGLAGRPADLIGLVAFARSAQVLAPLTIDHRILLQQLDLLNIMQVKDQDGTGIGYAIFKTANMIAATRHFAKDLKGPGKPAYVIKDAVMILVTDGMQDPNPLDQTNRFRWMDPEQAAAFAKDQHIRLYVINIDPEFSKPQWEANRKQMQRAAEMTGGKFYALNTSSRIESIYQEIDRLEKSSVPNAQQVSKFDRQLEKHTAIHLYPFFIGVSLLSMALSFVLQTTWLKVFP